MTARAAPAMVAAAVLSGCASGHGRIVVTATGHVGPLRLDESRRADVVSFAGRPDSEVHGRYQRTFDALGYGCDRKPAVDKFGIPQCRTVFYLDGHSGTLDLFYTRDRRYADPHGVRAGTPTTRASRRLGRHPFSGCYAGFRFDTKTGFLVMWLEGGRKLVGDHVGFVVVESPRRNPGVLDCIDS